MSDIAVKFLRTWWNNYSVIKIVTCVYSTASLLLSTSLAEPFAESEQSSKSHDFSKNNGEDDDDDDSYWHFSTKQLVCILSLLLILIVVIIIIIVCWRCWKQHHGQRSQLKHPFSPVHYPPCACLPRTNVCDHVRRNGGPGCNIEAIYDPRRCYACSAHNHQLHQCCWSANTHTGNTPPPAYPMRTTERTIDVSHASERAGPVHGGQLRSGTGDSSGDIEEHGTGAVRTAASPFQRPEPVSVVQQMSHVQNNRTAENRDTGQTALMPSSTFTNTSNHSSNGVLYTRGDDNVVLGSSMSSFNDQLDSGQGPMNIECPGLFEMFPASLRDMFVPGQRSEKRTVAGKLVVSVARLVDSKGDFLVLDNMGISLQIPPGAIRAGQRQLVTLVLNWDLGDNPDMDNRQALVSPVVYCGPHGLSLDKPCVLSFKHCAFDPRMIQVLSSQTELVEQKDWQLMCSAEDNSGTVAMTTDECQVRLQHFSLFTCIQTPPQDAIGRKWLQVAAFCAPLQRQVHHYQVRIYFLNKTPCALQWAIQNEARFGFRLACPERTFLFQGSGEDLHLTVGYLSPGWVAIHEDHVMADSEETDSVAYHSIWHGKCPHLSFCFKRSCLVQDSQSPPQPAMPPAGVTSDTSFPARRQTHASEINLDLAVFQDSSSNSPDRINLLLTEVPDGQQRQMAAASPSSFPDDPIPGCCPTHYLPACDKHPISISMPPVPVASGTIRGQVQIDPQASGSSVLLDFKQDPDCVPWPFFAVQAADPGSSGEGPHGEVFPQELKLKLRLKLDPSCPFGKDWKLLASKVGLDKYIRWLMSQDNPTMLVLQYMEMQKMTLECLYFYLKSMDRCDAASDVEDVISKRNKMTSKLSNEGQEHSHSSEDLQGVQYDTETKTWFMDENEQCSDVHDVISRRQRVTSRMEEGQEHSDGM